MCVYLGRRMRGWERGALSDGFICAQDTVPNAQCSLQLLHIIRQGRAAHHGTGRQTGRERGQGHRAGREGDRQAGRQT